MVRVTIKRTNWFLFFRRYEIKSESDLGYSIEKSTLELELKKGNQLVFSGDVYENSYFFGEKVDVSKISSPKTFKFNDSSIIEYCVPKKINGKNSTKVLFNGEFTAEVFYRVNWLNLSEYCDVNIFSEDKDVIDKIMFAIMHDYNFNQLYFGT
ncbi:hypothetical protein [Thalassotalea atypica]|uniref:hypothetical protein n=1 Tax=Thalassotalea atypica TaxID=2054316 RepID=UPI0025744FBC|nr:hypothetical protein [Thalassotalea atypica]